MKTVGVLEGGTVGRFFFHLLLSLYCFTIYKIHKSQMQFPCGTKKTLGHYSPLISQSSGHYLPKQSLVEMSDGDSIFGQRKGARKGLNHRNFSKAASRCQKNSDWSWGWIKEEISLKLDRKQILRMRPQRPMCLYHNLAQACPL